MLDALASPLEVESKETASRPQTRLVDNFHDVYVVAQCTWTKEFTDASMQLLFNLKKMSGVPPINRQLLVSFSYRFGGRSNDTIRCVFRIYIGKSLISSKKIYQHPSFMQTECINHRNQLQNKPITQSVTKTHTPTHQF